MQDSGGECRVLFEILPIRHLKEIANDVLCQDELKANFPHNKTGFNGWNQL